MDAVGVLVGNLDAELLLDGHDDLDGVEAVEAKIVGEVGSGLDLFGQVRDYCTLRKNQVPPVFSENGTYVGVIVDLGKESCQQLFAQDISITKPVSRSL